MPHIFLFLVIFTDFTMTNDCSITQMGFIHATTTLGKVQNKEEEQKRNMFHFFFFGGGGVWPKKILFFLFLFCFVKKGGGGGCIFPLFVFFLHFPNSQLYFDGKYAFVMCIIQPHPCRDPNILFEYFSSEKEHFVNYVFNMI